MTGVMRRSVVAAGLALMVGPGWTVPAAAEGWMGDDGLHKQVWMRDTFLDMSEDLAEAHAEGKRMVIFFEQRGCSYCAKMHDEVYSDAEASKFIEEKFFVVQLNLHGDREVIDLDGTTLSEKEIARRWRVLFTPTVLFLPDPEGIEGATSVADSAVAVMPGAFSKSTALDMFTWVAEKRYEMIDETGEDFQRYHARMIEQRGGDVLD